MLRAGRPPSPPPYARGAVEPRAASARRRTHADMPAGMARPSPGYLSGRPGVEDNSPMSSHRLRLGLAGALLAGLAAAGPAHAHPGAPPLQRLAAARPAPTFGCRDSYREVRRQGSSCRVAGGMWKVRLRDGSTVLTHGADPAGDPDAPAGALGFTHQLSPDVQPRQPVCADTSRFRALIAVPSDVAVDETADQFRAQIALADGTFYQAAVESGSAGGAHFRFACDAAGRVSVSVVTLPHALADSTFATITGDLKAAGYASTGEKYAVYFDGRLPGMCGQGTLHHDSRPGADNPSNFGPDYALVYHCADNESLTHEMSHTLGAVQDDAPHTSGHGHCLEALDIMCYADAGAGDARTMTSRCTDFDHLDCGHDDYFDARIGAGQGVGAGSYLAAHWNIAGCADAFVANTACDLAPPTVSAPTQEIERGGHAGTDGSVPVRLSWAGADTGGSGLARYVVWQSTDDGAWAQVALAGDLATALSRQLAAGHRYRFAVGALDGNGNASEYQYTPTFTVDAYQDTSTAIAWSSGWSRSTWSDAAGGTQTTSSGAGTWAQLSFTGRGVAWIAPQAGNRGEADAWLDGTRVERIDLRAAAVDARQVVFSRPLASGSHTLTIVVTGTAGRPWVDVDELAVLRSARLGRAPPGAPPPRGALSGLGLGPTRQGAGGPRGGQSHRAPGLEGVAAA